MLLSGADTAQRLSSANSERREPLAGCRKRSAGIKKTQLGRGAAGTMAEAEIPGALELHRRYNYIA